MLEPHRRGGSNDGVHIIYVMEQIKNKIKYIKYKLHFHYIKMGYKLIRGYYSQGTLSMGNITPKFFLMLQTFYINSLMDVK